MQTQPVTIRGLLLLALPVVTMTQMNLAMAQTPREVTTVSYKDIPQHVRIIGELGPLGELVTIRGKWTGKFKQPTFVVTELNGKPLKPSVKFTVIESAVNSPTRIVPIEEEEWEFRGVETGGFIGYSEQVYQEIAKSDIPKRIGSPRPSGFLTKFCYITATRISPEKALQPPLSPLVKEPKEQEEPKRQGEGPF